VRLNRHVQRVSLILYGYHSPPSGSPCETRTLWSGPGSCISRHASLAASCDRLYYPELGDDLESAKGFHRNRTRRVRQKISGGCPRLPKPSVSTTSPASFQWKFDPICAPAPGAQTPTQRSNASKVLAMLYGRCVAQADFCALSSAHLPPPRHNRSDCRLIRRQIMKYRQIAKANRLHEGEVVGRAELERRVGVPEKFARPNTAMRIGSPQVWNFAT